MINRPFSFQSICLSFVHLRFSTFVGIISFVFLSWILWGVLRVIRGLVLCVVDVCGLVDWWIGNYMSLS